MVDRDGVDGRSAQMALWIPPSWHQLRPLLEKFRDAKNANLDIHTDNEQELLDGEIYNLMCREGNICTLCSNFRYRTQLHRALEAAEREAMLNTDGSQTEQSPGSSVATRASDWLMADSSDDESPVQSIASQPVTLFLIYTKDDIVSSSSDALRQRITTSVEIFRVLYPTVRLLVIMHGIRLYALHGHNSTESSQSPQREAQAPLIHNLTLDDIICSLMVEYQVDTVEAEDDVELVSDGLLNESNA
ncbi:ERCC4 domain-containing protein, putative [Babesia caballi]|uniref:ERCC4 domain-containing protein, putative n=1 Tax=Babesia caballi TaxID=5871 RepID=A0AAV4LUZ9_BABCB|nr:ERCC4 domain-containing protein, putative [Babesia caballi]